MAYVPVKFKWFGYHVRNWQYLPQLTRVRPMRDGWTYLLILLQLVIDEVYGDRLGAFLQRRRLIKCAERIGPRGRTTLVRRASRFRWPLRWWWA
jgi:hypothetical protein